MDSFHQRRGSDPRHGYHPRYGFAPRYAFALAAAPVSALIAALLTGCAAVKPFERGDLARKCMQSPFSRQELKSDYENKVLQTATGAELPGGTPGGGCGCTR